MQVQAVQFQFDTMLPHFFFCISLNTDLHASNLNMHNFIFPVVSEEENLLTFKWEHPLHKKKKAAWKY